MLACMNDQKIKDDAHACVVAACACVDGRACGLLHAHVWTMHTHVWMMHANVWMDAHVWMMHTCIHDEKNMDNVQMHEHISMDDAERFSESQMMYNTIYGCCTTVWVMHTACMDDGHFICIYVVNIYE